MTNLIQTATVGSYLIDRLYELGVRHIFGVPGDFSLRFCQQLEAENKIAFIGTTREDTAGFAADGYARRHEGLGVVLVTHGVGALSAVNPLAGANAESSPVLIISGAPGLNEQADRNLIHHSFGKEGAQRNIFEHFTCRSVSIRSASDAARQIDEVIEQVWTKKKPGYLELPRDLMDREITLTSPPEAFCRFDSSDGAALEEALQETTALVAAARSPVILAGVQLHRFNVQNELVSLAETAALPVAATIMGKTVFNERHPLYLGIYQGLVGSETAQQAVEAADLVLALGVMFTDVNLGMYTAKLDLNRMVRAQQGEVKIKHHSFREVTLKDFLRGLQSRLQGRKPNPEPKRMPQKPPDTPPSPSAGSLTSSGIIRILNRRLTPELAVVSDTGDCLFAAVDLCVPDKTAFFASAFYTTMGFAIPAALGVSCAAPDTRPLILVGDGAFQMTGTELSTYRKLELAPIVIVFNNAGYETERAILDGHFNDIVAWDYGSVCRLLQYGTALKVSTEEELERALDRALADRAGMYVIDAVVKEASRGMRRLAGEIGRRLRQKS